MRTFMRIGMGPCAMMVGLSLAASVARAEGPVTNVYVGPMTNNATLNWLWATQYSFRAAAPVHGAISGSSNDWYDAGTAISVQATPEPHYTFSLWQNVAGGTSTNNPLNFALTAPYTNMTAVFALTQYAITVHSDYGTPHPGSTNATAFGYSEQSIAPAIVDTAPGVRVRLSGYDVQGAEVSTNAP